MVLPREDLQLILDAIVYTGAVHADAAAENTEPAPGIMGRVVAAILADPALADYVRCWAGERRALEATVIPLPLPPFDATYQRVRELLRRTGDQPRRVL